MNDLTPKEKEDLLVIIHLGLTLMHAGNKKSKVSADEFYKVTLPKIKLALREPTSTMMPLRKNALTTIIKKAP